MKPPRSELSAFNAANDVNTHLIAFIAFPLILLEILWTGEDPSNFKEFPRQYVHHFYFSNIMRNIIVQMLLWPEAGPRTKDRGFGGWSAKAWDKGRRR